MLITNQRPARLWNSYLWISIGIIFTCAWFGLLLVVYTGFFVLTYVWVSFTAVLTAMLAYENRWMRTVWPVSLVVDEAALTLHYRNGHQRKIRWNDISELEMRPRRRFHETYVNIWYRSGERETRADIIGSAAHELIDFLRSKQSGITVTTRP